MTENWEAAAKREINWHPEEPFSPVLYGNALYKDQLSEHTFAWRMLVVLNEIYLMLREDPAKPALAQTTCALKALFVFLQQGGLWKGAWEFTYLPELKEKKGGVTEAERASVVRSLQETAKLEEILAEERGKPAPKAKTKH